MAFYNTIHAAYPDVTLIPSTDDPTADPGHSRNDYHKYARSNIYATQFGLWDNANRSPPILLGEYATIQPNTGVLLSQGCNIQSGLAPWLKRFIP
jgi:alpha-N-arabinofuranosidase